MSDNAKVATFLLTSFLLMGLFVWALIEVGNNPSEESIRCAQMGGEWISGYGGKVHTCFEKSAVLFR